MQRNEVINPDGAHTQSPNGTADEEVVRKIAAKIRAIRTAKNLTIQQLAERAQVTKGLLSKIENSRTIPSLPVFVKILRSLGVSFQDFFKDMEGQDEQRYILVKNQNAPSAPASLNGSIQDKEQLKELNESKIQMSFLNLNSGSSSSKELQVLPGYRFIHLTSGAVEYHANDNIIHLRCGDSLYFDGRVSHRLLNSLGEEATLLVIDFFV